MVRARRQHCRVTLTRTQYRRNMDTAPIGSSMGRPAQNDASTKGAISHTAAYSCTYKRREVRPQATTSQLTATIHDGHEHNVQDDRQTVGEAELGSHEQGVQVVLKTKGIEWVERVGF